MTTIDPLKLLAIARDIAVEAGGLAATMRNAGISVQSTKSSQLDIVTQADIRVEALIRERLRALRPEDGFLGEESGDDEAGTSGITWVVDPIDGTVNYLYGSPNYAVSIAATVLEENGVRKAVAGCVYAPALGAQYTAAVGHHAYLNGTQIRVNSNVPLDRALVATGFTYDLAKRERQKQTVAALVPYIRDFRMVGTASLDICAVASGTVDAHYMRGLPIWDYAAAALIAAQAGAKVGGLAEDPPSAELILVADPELTQALEPFLR
ncbi:inositol monophosphatase [Arthrobacter sp. 2RAF6]|uniref:inositol monophosphatase family protein n=1 Tax=Arthrobacter sp. 2RAF6 TaxID=3233002 RepID=UPI003F8E1E0D